MRFFGMFLAALTLAAPDARALTGVLADDARGFALGGYRAEARDLVLAPELSDLGDHEGFGLTQDAREDLLGRYGTRAADVLRKLAPHLEAASLTLAKADMGGHGRSVHERYKLVYRGLELHDAYLSLHHHDNRLVMVRARLPSYRLPSEGFDDGDFLPVAEMGLFEPGALASVQATRVIAEALGHAAPAWRLSRYDRETGVTDRWLVDAQTATVLSHEQVAFDLVTAQVYERGPHEGSLRGVALEGLPRTGYLDGARFRVYAPSEADPRAMAPDLTFDFLPDDPAEALLFDQVQAYYGATRALRWLVKRFGYDESKVAGMPVRINAMVGGRADNAQYVPPPEGPEIVIGAGGGALQNLARDTDVVTHELAHHVIFEYLSSHRGEAGIYHEGTSDYFAYALNGDPYLGESVVPGGSFLRTAALPADATFDTYALGREPHARGQVWAAALWELRGELGEAFDLTVFESLRYLGPSSGFRDAILGLLAADRDLTASAGRCAILRRTAARGFASFMRELDGSDCGLDLATLGAQSQTRLDEWRRSRTKKPAGGVETQITSAVCGVVHGAAKWPLAGLVLGLGPWLLTAWRRKDGGET